LPVKNEYLSQKALLTLISFLVFSCSKEEALPVTANFEFEVFNNDFLVPVEVIIFNAIPAIASL